MNVAVIGAGYAGLAAAAALSRAGVPVTVYEANATPGGRARRVDAQGFSVDNGAHILIGAYRETLALLREVGVDLDAVLLRLPLDWDVHAAFRFTAANLPAPLHLAGGLARVRGASWRERWAALSFLRAMRRIEYRLERDCSVASLLERHGQGRAFTRYLWEPLCLAALNTPPVRASAQVFLNVLRDGLDASRAASDILLPRVDLTALFPEHAIRYVQAHGGAVRLRTVVQRVAHERGRYRVGTREGEREHTHIVCATSPHHVNALLGSLPELAALRYTIDRLRYEPICTVYLQYAAPVALPKPMLGLRDGPGHWAFDRGAIAGERGRIAVILSAGGAHTTLSHEELARDVHANIARSFRFAQKPAAWRVIAEKRATFACEAGVARPPSTTPLPGLLLAGDYTASEYPGTIEAAIRSGLACARSVLS
jgi:squalene-associated FAD-dependent desaturase